MWWSTKSSPRQKNPAPKYTTVATFLKILENKGFVNHTPEGKSHRYYPADRPRGVCPRRHVVDAFQLFRRLAGPDWCRSSRAMKTSPPREMDEILEIMQQRPQIIARSAPSPYDRENPRHLRPRSAGLQRRAAGGLRHPARTARAVRLVQGLPARHRPSWRRSFRCCASPSGRAR